MITLRVLSRRMKQRRGGGGGGGGGPYKTKWGFQVESAAAAPHWHVCIHSEYHINYTVLTWSYPYNLVDDTHTSTVAYAT